MRSLIEPTADGDRDLGLLLAETGRGARLTRDLEVRNGAGASLPQDFRSLSMACASR